MKKILASLIVLSILFVFGCSAQDSFERAVEQNDYQKAISIYNEKISGDSQQEEEAYQYLLARLYNMIDEYAEGKLSEQEYTVGFDCMMELCNRGITELIVQLPMIEKEHLMLQESKSSYSMAQEKIDAGEYVEAMTLLDSVYEGDIENYSNAKQQYEETQQTYQKVFIEKIENMIKEDKYYEAISEYILAEYIDLNDPVLIEKISLCKECYFDQIINEAIVLYKEQGALTAKNKVSQAIELLPDNAKLNELYMLLESAVPVELYNLTVIDSDAGPKSTHYYSGTVTDVYGNEYIGHYNLDVNYWVRSVDYVTYYLDRKYTTFDVTYFPASSMKDDWNVSLRVFADDIEIYNSGYLNYQAKAKTISLDVTNVEKITVKSGSTSYGGPTAASWGNYPTMYLTNASVLKQLTDDDFQQIIK